MFKYDFLITGAGGLIGKNLSTKMRKQGYSILDVDSSAVDLTDQHSALEFLKHAKPRMIIHLAAKVGGIRANMNNKFDFINANLLINTNLVNAAIKSNVQKIYAAGTGCAYPTRLEGSLLRAELFLDGLPEPTNAAHAFAKRVLLNHLEAARESGVMDYCYFIPANIYGAHDNFNLTESHVVPGLMHRLYLSKNQEETEFQVWGDGTAKRDFLHIEDCCEAIITCLENDYSGRLNIASGKQVSIRQLAFELRNLICPDIHLNFGEPSENGQSTRVMCTKKISKLGWSPKVDLTQGLGNTYNWFVTNYRAARIGK